MLLICNNLLFSILYDVIFLGELYFDLKFSAPIFSFCSNILVFLFNFGGCGNERKLSSVDEEEDNIF